MYTGAGRGRGWLHLGKDPINPGGVPSTLDSLSLSLSSTQIQQYKQILNLIDQLDETDDGILLNRKFKAIIHQWKSDTNSAAEVKESFKYIYAEARKSFSLAKKLVLMISSYSFCTVTVQDVKLRNLLLIELQKDFDNRIQMQALLPNEFRISLCLLTGFFSKARLSYGRIVYVLAVPALQYFNMLVESGTPSDLELLTSQLYITGSNFLEEFSEKMEEFLIHVRQVLVKNNFLTASSRTWMLLILDLANNQFNSLPQELYKFYQEELGDAAMSNYNFESKHHVLSIDTAEVIKNHNNFQSADVLKTSPSEPALSISESTNNINNHQQLDTNFGNYENVEPVPFINDREKVGRPILGVGARLQKNECTSNWREENRTKSTSREDNTRPTYQPWTSTREKPNSENDKNRVFRNPVKHNKGWEHDDRFENNYD